LINTCPLPHNRSDAILRHALRLIYWRNAGGRPHYQNRSLTDEQPISAAELPLAQNSQRPMRSWSIRTLLECVNGATRHGLGKAGSGDVTC